VESCLASPAVAAAMPRPVRHRGREPSVNAKPYGLAFSSGPDQRGAAQGGSLGIAARRTFELASPAVRGEP